MTSARIAALAMRLSIAAASAGSSAPAAAQAPTVVDPDGTLHVPALVL